MFKEKRFRVSIRQCRVLLNESGGKGDKKKAVQWISALICFVKISSWKKERKKTTSSLWDHRHSGLVWDVILPFNLVVFQRKWLSSNFPHRKQNTQVWFRSTNVREESRKLILSYFMRTENFVFLFYLLARFFISSIQKKSSALRRRHGNTKRLCKVLFKKLPLLRSPHFFFPNVPN